VCGWQVKLCDPLVTRGPYMSASEIRSLYIKRYINSPSFLQDNAAQIRQDNTTKAAIKTALIVAVKIEHSS